MKMKKGLFFLGLVFLMAGVFAQSTCDKADFNSDGVVDKYDLGKLDKYFNFEDCSSSDWCEGTDLNKDGKVDVIDFNLFSDEYGERCTDSKESSKGFFKKEEKPCFSKWSCGEWGGCFTSYNLEDVVLGLRESKGIQERVCEDLNKCSPPVTKSRECKVSIPIEARFLKWCFKDYVELVDKNTGNIIGRIRKEDSLLKADFKKIDLSFTDSELNETCDYCFDGVMNYDETGVDCGGSSCPACVEIYEMGFNWLGLVFWILWIVLFSLILLFFQNEKNMGSFGERGLLQSKFILGIKKLVNPAGEKLRSFETYAEDFVSEVFHHDSLGEGSAGVEDAGEYFKD